MLQCVWCSGKLHRHLIVSGSLHEKCIHKLCVCNCAFERKLCKTFVCKNKKGWIRILKQAALTLMRSNFYGVNTKTKQTTPKTQLRIYRLFKTLLTKALSKHLFSHSIPSSTYVSVPTMNKLERRIKEREEEIRNPFEWFWKWRSQENYRIRLCTWQLMYISIDT